MRKIVTGRMAPVKLATLMVAFAAILTGAFAVWGTATAEPAARRLVAYSVDYADGTDGVICAFDLKDLYTFDPKFGQEFDWSNPRRSPSDDVLCNNPKTN